METYLAPTFSSPQRNSGSLERTAEPWPCDQLAGCLHGADEESLTVRGNCKSVACVPSPSDHVFVSSTLCVALPWSMQLTLGLQPSPHRPILII